MMNSPARTTSFTAVTLFQATPRAPQEIEALKLRWRQGGRLWNIENSDGFEAHFVELLAYRLECEANSYVKRKEQADQHELTLLADRLGCPDNLALARYVLNLERALLRFEEPGLRLQSVR
ncbi:hypothetical protein QCD60_29470 [Pokkaliibacter sp. MBI-7]|uniref:hypothetical protein n=1 Tax=Pokkaliibacter sp. MBI-7 TaxID=3040600 RepID=UPI00244A458E|nr:hypothetical protein [Pokkaliibacter sp. MBI-7]MDH2436647.1 hypothetical protein [Pokkaliibacter sp. MBI-7]